MMNSKGIGLPELLISLFLASLILSALVNIYLSAKKEYFYLQERLGSEVDVVNVIEVMRDSIHRAGFTPCLNLNQLKSYDAHTRKALLPAIVLNSQRATSLNINRMSEQFASVVTVVNDTELKLKEEASWIQQNKKIIIANCTYAEVHEVTQVKHKHQETIVTLNSPLYYHYEGEMYVGEWIEEKFYIHQQHNKSVLYYQFHHADELTSSINSMKLKMQEEQKLVEVTLGLNHGKEIQFTSAVRE